MMSSAALTELSYNIRLAVEQLQADYGYEYSSILGRGTYGSVVKVRKNNSDYAAKIVERRMINQIEISVWPQLKHRNVLKLRHSLTDLTEAVVFFTDVMDTNLFVRLNSHEFREDPKALERSRAYVKQVYQGMCYLHKHKLAHLDLRAENVFLTVAEDRAVVADFSGLCWAESEKRFCPLPHSLRPPEMLTGRARVRPKPIDLWAAGLLLANAFLGKGFYACTVKNKMAGHLEAVRQYTGFFQCQAYVRKFVCETYPSCSLADPSIGTLIHLLGRLLRTDPQDRLGMEEALKHPFLNGDLGVVRVAQQVVEEEKNPLPAIVQALGEDKSSGKLNGGALQVRFTKTKSEVVAKLKHRPELKDKPKVSRWTRAKTRLVSFKFSPKPIPFFSKIRFKNSRKGKKSKSKKDKDMDDDTHE